MVRQALGAFERQDTGDWICFRDTDISISPTLAVHVSKGTRFAPHTVFAGFNDFTTHLESISVDCAGASPLHC